MGHTVYFVRHGETDWNAEGRLQGQADTDINARGRLQASRNGATLARLIADPAAFRYVASPLRRTRETMERLRIALRLPRLGYETDPRLVEVHFGDWQGRTFPELEKVDVGCWTRRQADKWNYLPPGAAAESYAMLAERVRPWLDSIAADMVCVTHGGVIRSLFRLTGSLDEHEAAAMSVPQDRVLRLRDEKLDWI